jgi:hypothetical protein
MSLILLERYRGICPKGLRKTTNTSWKRSRFDLTCSVVDEKCILFFFREISWKTAILKTKGNWVVGGNIEMNSGYKDRRRMGIGSG